MQGWTNFFLNLVKSNQILIVITLYRLIWHQNQSKKGAYNLNFVRFPKNLKRFLRNVYFFSCRDGRKQRVRDSVPRTLTNAPLVACTVVPPTPGPTASTFLEATCVALALTVINDNKLYFVIKVT